MNTKQVLALYPELGPLVEGAEVLDVKTARGNKSLRGFLASFFSYGADGPVWLRAGSGLRDALARSLGLTLPSLVLKKRVAPQNIPFGYGQRFEFFTVVMARENAFWAASTGDAHLDVRMIIAVRNPEQGGQREFSVLTAVTHRTWRGRLYYALVRPMHHVGVQLLTSAGARGKSPRFGGKGQD